MLTEFKVDQTQIRTLATTIGGSVFLAFSIFGLEGVARLGTSGRILVMLAGVLSLNGFIAILNWALVRFWWARAFYGQWYYHSNSNQLSNIGHVSRVDIHVRNFSLTYRVQIFSFSDADQMISDRYDPPIQGTAKSKVIFYDGDDSLEILYEVAMANGGGGAGILYLSNASSGRSMTGRWVTARDDQVARSGTSQWFRRDDFKEYLKRIGAVPSQSDVSE